jgi:hypothetical protein
VVLTAITYTVQWFNDKFIFLFGITTSPSFTETRGKEHIGERRGDVVLPDKMCEYQLEIAACVPHLLMQLYTINCSHPSCRLHNKTLKTTLPNIIRVINPRGNELGMGK